MAHSGRMSSWRHLLGAAVAVALVAGAASSAALAGHQSRTTTTKQLTLKIGMVLPMSGVGAPYGLPQRYAWQAIVRGVNAHGGLKVGSKKYHVVLNAVDDKWDPATENNQTVQMISSGIRFIVTNGSPQDVVIVPLTEKKKVFVFDASANKFLIKPPHKYVFNYYLNPNVLGGPFFVQLHKLHPKTKSVYFVAEDVQFARTNVGWAEQAARAHGLTVKGSTFFAPGTVDFTAPLTAAANAHPDMITFGDIGTDSGPLIKTLRSLGYQGLITSIATGSESVADTIKSGGSFANGYVETEWISYPATPGLKSYEKQYKAVSGGSFTSTSAVYAMQALAVLKALSNAGTVTNTKKIGQALVAVKVRDPFVKGSPLVGMGGSKTYGQKRELQTPFTMNEDRNGKVVTLAVLHTRIP